MNNCILPFQIKLRCFFYDLKFVTLVAFRISSSNCCDYSMLKHADFRRNSVCNRKLHFECCVNLFLYCDISVSKIFSQAAQSGTFRSIIYFNVWLYE